MLIIVIFVRKYIMLKPCSREWKWVDISLIGRDRIGYKDTKRRFCVE